MSWRDRRRAGPPAAEAAGGAVDRETGEILAGAVSVSADGDGRTGDDAAGRAVAGERSIPSVNRERSMQSRISGALALGTMVLLGAGFLFWYYHTQYAKTREAEAAARKAAAARAGGEMKVPPLRLEAPKPPERAAVAAAPASALPAPPPAATPGAGAPPKTPEQLALERQLGLPVLRRAPAAAAPASPAPAAAAFQAMPFSAAGLPFAGSLPGSAGADSLATRLQPTPSPAASAQLLPTRRMLLPKGAFIDCTLETAIDSTYPGMVTCIGAGDVYGADGRVVLLERGTKYVGEQRGEPRQGQARVFVLWHEARTPTGVVVPLASPGTDALGRSGLAGFVDTHFWQRFGAALLVSVLDGVMEVAAANQRGGSDGGHGGGAVIGAQGGRDVAAEVLRSTVSIPPTVIKHQGDRIQILVARDVDFRTVYGLRSDFSRP
jgi:type IV secretion system protein VirB10